MDCLTKKSQELLITAQTLINISFVICSQFVDMLEMEIKTANRYFFFHKYSHRYLNI